MKPMRKRTSSAGRRQFSVEKAYTVSHRTPRSSAPSHRVEQRFLAGSVAVGALQTLAVGPTDRCRPSPRRCAAGMRRASMSGTSTGGGYRCLLGPPGTIGDLMGAADRLVANTREALETITAALPAGEERPGQVEMAEAVAGHRRAATISWCRPAPAPARRFAYLVPAILSGRRVVVATATKALQDQLAGKDLPFLAEHLDRPVRVRGAEGPVQLRVPAAGRRARQRRRPARPRRSAPGRRRRDRRAWPAGPAAPTPATGPSWPSSLRPGLGGRERRPTRVPRGARCPRARRASPSGPGGRRRRPTSWWSTSTSTAWTWPPAGPCCPSTSWWSSTRPTSSRTSSPPPPASSSPAAGSPSLARTIGAIVDRPCPHRAGSTSCGAAAGAAPWPSELGRRLRGLLDGEPARVLDLARARLDRGHDRAAGRPRRRPRRRRGPQAAAP